MATVRELLDGAVARLRESGSESARLDAELLAEVYLAMTRGQESLLMELEAPSPLDLDISLHDLQLVVLPASAEELEAHALQLEMIEKESKGKCLWMRLDPVEV